MSVELNDGARALRACGKTQTEIARELKITKQVVGRWFNGKAKPGPDHRIVLEARGWARASQWDSDKGGVAGTIHNALTAPEAAPEDPVVELLGTREELLLQAKRLRTLLNRSDLSASAQVQTERALSSVLGAVARLEGVKISESTIVRHPAHRAVMAAVLGALEPFPEALRAVADVLHARER